MTGVVGGPAITWSHVNQAIARMIALASDGQSGGGQRWVARNLLMSLGEEPSDTLNKERLDWLSKPDRSLADMLVQVGSDDPHGLDRVLARHREALTAIYMEECEIREIGFELHWTRVKARRKAPGAG